MFDGSMCLISAGECEDSIEFGLESLCGEFEKSGESLWSTKEDCLGMNGDLLGGSRGLARIESFFKLE